MREQTPKQTTVHPVMQELLDDVWRRADIAACHNFAWVSVERLTEALSALSARCTALAAENLSLQSAFAFERHKLEVAEARCTALEQERDKEQNKADVRGNMLRYVAFVTTGDESGDAQLGVDRLKARCQHLEQALQQYVESEAFDALAYRYRTSPKEDAGSVMNAFDAPKDGILAAVRLSRPQTETDRVSFAAGYTAALDDALKGKP